MEKGGNLSLKCSKNIVLVGNRAQEGDYIGESFRGKMGGNGGKW